MVRKHKLVKSSADLKIEKQVQDPNSVRSKNHSNWSSNIVPPPSICHGSESCGCFCHYAQDDPPPCYNCCQEQSDDYSLAQKVLMGKKDSLSRGKSYHSQQLKDYVLRDEFGLVIPKYKKKKNERALNSSKVLHDESSSKFAFGAKDSLRLNREFSLNQVEDLNIENLLIAANKSTNHRIKANNIFNAESHINRILSHQEANRILLQHQLNDYALRDEFGLEIPKYKKKKNKRALNSSKEVRNSTHKGCAVS